jgi:hypothetical protein
MNSERPCKTVGVCERACVIHVTEFIKGPLLKITFFLQTLVHQQNNIIYVCKEQKQMSDEIVFCSVFSNLFNNNSCLPLFLQRSDEIVFFRSIQQAKQADYFHEHYDTLMN